MCGIAGIMLKSGRPRSNISTGTALIEMLDGCQHRGPDSTGFALYSAYTEGQLKLRFLIGEGASADESVRLIKAALLERGARVLDEERIGDNYKVKVQVSGDLRKFAYAMEHAAPDAKVISIGESLEIVKDIGGAHDVDDAYHVRDFHGTHGIGHVRLATESDVTPDASHPFWATGFSDVAIVHNGQITNYYKMRRRLEKRG